MKKLISILLLICIVLSCGCLTACSSADAAASDTEAAETAETDAAEPAAETGASAEEADAGSSGMENSVPAVGDTVGEFTVTASEPFDMLGATVLTLTHEQSGGTVVWVANDDTNRSFVIGFRTHYDEDTGVPHVFEHAALSGSEKYPDSGLFFTMCNQLYQTYMNATTNTNWTMYEVASLSDEQLLRMTDYILAGVFEPLVLTDEHAMMREAYRYELPDADSDISLVGTVYSEMQSAYYTNARYYTMIKLLSPGSWHGTCTGGVPGVIEQMTQQDLIDFHDTYYQPCNALAVLYGDLDLASYLDLIASYYDSYTAGEVSADDPDYTPFTGYERIDAAYPASSSESPDSTLLYAVPLTGYSDSDLYMLNTFLGEAICNDSSAYQKLMMERFPAGSASVSMLQTSESGEPMLIFELDYADGVDPDEYLAAVKEGLAADLEEGLCYDVLEADLKTNRIDIIKAREGSDIGVNYGMAIISAYAETGYSDTFFTRINALLNDGEDWLGSGILETVIEDRLLEPADSRLLVLSKELGAVEEISAESAETLAEMKAGMSSDEIQALVDRTADYNAWVEQAAASSQIDEIKAVEVSDLPVEVKTYTANDETEDGIRYVTSDSENSDLIGLSLYFDASAVAAEDLTRYGTVTSLLGSLSTSEHSYDEVSLMVQQYGISFSNDTLGPTDDPDTYRPVFVANIECLREDLPAALDAVWEILTETTFDETALINYMLSDLVNYNKLYMSSYVPYRLAIAYANAALSASGRYSFEISATPILQYMDSLLDMDETAMTAETDAWQNILTGLLNRRDLIVTAVSGQDGIDEALAELAPYTDTLADEDRTPADLSSLTLLPQSQAVIVPGSSNHNLQMARSDAGGLSYNSTMSAMNSLVSDMILYPVMRYQNGVYTPLSDISRKRNMILAYSDPSIAVTYDEVIPSIADTVRSLDITQEELDSYIIAAYTTLAMPYGPITGASAAVSDAINGNDTFADIQADMETLRAMTPADLAEDAAAYDVLCEDGVIVTVGTADAIAAESGRFDTVEDWYVS